jgi:outer membrane lipopolysaccharide assembly protein LptE/RlpB
MVLKTTVAAAALMLSAMAIPASAQQEGLVNVDISGNTVQVPVAVAAQLCDTDVNVLAQQKEKGGVACSITQQQATQRGFTGQDQGQGQAQQNGLVNVNIDNNTVQVPVSVAAQLCDTDVNLLAKQKEKGDVACNITQQQAAQRGFTGQGQGQSQEQGLSTDQGQSQQQ